MRLAVFTHVPHRIKKDQFYGYAPYIREMNLWFQYAEEVEVVAPLPSEMNISAEIPYQKEISFTEIPSIDFLTLKRGVRALVKIPSILLSIYKAMKRADHIHLRCPGNIGLLACVVQIFFPEKPKTAKYAGNWNPNAEQPWSYKFQKWILSNTFLSRNMQVLVYGKWPDQSKNVVSFFTASFSKNEIPVPEKSFQKPFLFLFVGNLVSGKQPLFAIKLVEKLRERNFHVSMEIYGDGILREELEQYSLKNNLLEFILFKGNQALETVKEAYKKAHFLVLPSKSEGWPKAIAEAMFFGCIPIATPVSCVPWMLGFGKRGVLLEEGDKVTERIINLLENPVEVKKKSLAAQEWSQEYTLERFEAGIEGVLKLTK